MYKRQEQRNSFCSTTLLKATTKVQLLQRIHGVLVRLNGKHWNRLRVMENWGEQLPVVYRWPYEYGLPEATADFVPQNVPDEQIT